MSPKNLPSRRTVLRAALWLLLLPGCHAEVVARSADLHPRVSELSFNVSSLAGAARFLEEALGAAAESEEHRLDGPAFATASGLPAPAATTRRVRFGSEPITLTRFEPPRGGAPGDSRSNDLWFEHAAIVVGDLDEAARRLGHAGARLISDGPQTIPASNPAAGGIRALYFRGPDDHPLEVIWYPPGRGLPRWQEHGDQLVLGIDHTAIGVADTARSVAFYRDLLGLSVAGESLNEGREQAALSGVPGARVHITGLRGGEGMGVELLEYLAPRDGRPLRAEVGVDDLVRWAITIEVDRLDEVAMRLVRAGVAARSAAPVDVSSLGLSWRRELLVSDPDGHLVRLVERSS